MELKDMCKSALQVQDACNLCGVVQEFARIIHELRIGDPYKGTDEINQHPVCVLYADKIASLAGVQGITTRTMDTYSAAYKFCKENAESGGK